MYYDFSGGGGRSPTLAPLLLLRTPMSMTVSLSITKFRPMISQNEYEIMFNVSSLLLHVVRVTYPRSFVACIQSYLC